MFIKCHIIYFENLISEQFAKIYILIVYLIIISTKILLMRKINLIVLYKLSYKQHCRLVYLLRVLGSSTRCNLLLVENKNIQMQ